MASEERFHEFIGLDGTLIDEDLHAMHANEPSFLEGKSQASHTCICIYFYPWGAMVDSYAYTCVFGCFE